MRILLFCLFSLFAGFALGSVPNQHKAALATIFLSLLFAGLAWKLDFLYFYAVPCPVLGWLTYLIFKGKDNP